MARALTSRQIAEWEAFYELEPFGDEWRMAATLAMLIYNANRSKGAPVLRVEDFMPGNPRALLVPPKAQSLKDQKAAALALAKALGAKIIHRTKGE